MKAIPRAVLVVSALLLPTNLRAEPVADNSPLSSWIGRLKLPISPVLDSIMRVSSRGSGGVHWGNNNFRCANYALRKLGAQAAPAVPALIDLLRDDGNGACQEAVETLAAIGLPAIEPLKRALTDAESPRRAAAARALGLIGKPAKSAVPALFKVVTDSVPEVRRAAGEALWLVDHDTRGVTAITEGLSSADIATRRNSARLLARIGPAARPAVDALIRSLAELLVFPEEDNGGALGVYCEPERPVAALAADALASIGPDARTAVPALKKLLRHPENALDDTSALLDIRVSAARALLDLVCAPDIALPVFLEGLRFPGISSRSQGSVKPPCLQWDAFGQYIAKWKRHGPIVMPVLIGALDDKDDGIRTAAVAALRSFHKLPKEAMPGLRRLSLRNSSVQLALARFGEKLDAKAINNLCELTAADAYFLEPGNGPDVLIQGLILSKASSIPLLVKALENDKPEIRAGAAELLARFGPEARGAAPALRLLLKKEPERLPDAGERAAQTWAAIALAKMGAPPGDVVPLFINAQIALAAPSNGNDGLIWLRKRARSAAVRQALVRQAQSKIPQVIPALLELLGVNRDADRSVAAEGLLRIYQAKGAPAPKELADALLTGDVLLRTEAAKLLADIRRGSPEVLTALRAALDDTEPLVRIHAAKALWRIEGKAAAVLPELCEGLKDPDVFVRLEAVTVLGELGAAALPCIPEIVLLWEDPEVRIHDAAILAFYRFVPDAVPALISLLDHPNPGVSAKATELLGSFGPGAIEPLIRTVRRATDHARFQAVEALNSQGDIAHAALPVLRLLLKQDDVQLRLAAARAIWNIGKESKETLPVFLAALRHRDVEARRQAAETLQAMGAAAAGAAPLLEQSLDDDDEGVRLASILALITVPDGKRALPVLIRILRSARSERPAFLCRLCHRCVSSGRRRREIRHSRAHDGLEGWRSPRAGNCGTCFVFVGGQGSTCASRVDRRSG